MSNALKSLDKISLAYDRATESLLISLRFGSYQVIDSIQISGMKAGNINPQDIIDGMLTAAGLDQGEVKE